MQKLMEILMHMSVCVAVRVYWCFFLVLYRSFGGLAISLFQNMAISSAILIFYK